MDLTLALKAILIGIVEGLTEFLPVSSTAHMLIANHVIGFDGDSGHAFEIVIQLGAILAVCWLYRARLWQVARNLPKERGAQVFTRNILIAFFPAALIGLLWHDVITQYLFNLHVIAWALLLGGIAIIVIERLQKIVKFQAVEQLPCHVVLLIGCFQAIALIPGVSRSGATIMSALLLGVERKTAAEFSFFLAIPVMLGATMFSLYKSWSTLSEQNVELIVVGFLAAFVSALIVVRWMIGFVTRHGFQPFGWYRIIVGVVMLLLLQ